MKMRRSFSFVLILLLSGFVATADAQPTLPEHRYMVAEHTAINHLAGLFDRSFRPVEIVKVAVPEQIEAGTPAAFAVIANVETATLPIRGTWDFDDGTTTTGLSVEHTYMEPGTYEVRVEVSNTRSSESRTFTVEVVGHGRRS